MKYCCLLSQRQWIEIGIMNEIAPFLCLTEIDLMHMTSRHRNRRAPPLVGGQTRHCRVRQAKHAASGPTPACHTAGPARARAPTRSQRSFNTARAHSATVNLTPNVASWLVVMEMMTSMHKVYSQMSLFESQKGTLSLVFKNFPLSTRRVLFP